MNIYDYIRKLARSYKYQFLYNRSKEINNISIFINKEDLTKLQLEFLQWMTIYDSLYDDLRQKEEFMTEEVIVDDLRTEAYIMYKSKKLAGTLTKFEKKQRDIHGPIPTIIFKKKDVK
jgi:hypothetical protein